MKAELCTYIHRTRQAGWRACRQCTRLGLRCRRPKRSDTCQRSPGATPPALQSIHPKRLDAQIAIMSRYSAVSTRSPSVARARQGGATTAANSDTSDEEAAFYSSWAKTSKTGRDALGVSYAMGKVSPPWRDPCLVCKGRGAEHAGRRARESGKAKQWPLDLGARVIQTLRVLQGKARGVAVGRKRR